MKKLFKSITIFILISTFLLIIISFVSNIFLIENQNHTMDNEVEVDNVKINYKQFGNGSTPLLILHGFLGSSKDFEALSKNLSNNKNIKVISMDLIGFGLSSKDESLNYSIQNMSKLCIDFMEKLGYKKFNVLGADIGGKISLNMCLNYTNSVEKLILLDTDICNKTNNTAQIYSSIKQLYFNYPVQLFIYFNKFFNKNNIDLSTFEYNFSNNTNLSNITLNKICFAKNSINFKDRLNLIKNKTLILWGRDDTITPISYAFDIHKNIKNSELHIIENCGHMPYVEAYNTINNDISKFLQN